MSTPTAFRFAVNVRPKAGILDPQGRAVEGSLPPPRGDRRVGRPRRAAGRADGGRGQRGRGPRDGRTAGRRAAEQPAHRGLCDRGARGDLVDRVRAGAVGSAGADGPGRRRRVPGLEPRHRRGQRPPRRRRRAGGRCGTSRRTWRASTAIVLPGGFAYGDYLRAGVIARFSPVMRAVAGLRRGRRARARDLQRLPGPDRGRARCRARCCATASLRFVRARGRDPPRAARHAVHPRRSTRAAPLRMPVAHGEGCYYADAGDARRARGRRPGPVPLRRRRTAARRRRGGPGEPERLAPGDRRGDERGRQRRRADAPSGDRRRGGPRPRRRARDRPLARRQRGGARRDRPRAGRRRRRSRDDRGRGTGRCAEPSRSIAGSASPTTSSTAIRERLGREPNDLELAMFSVMWSEHCSYKSSKPLLRTLPTAGRGRRRRPGRERRRHLDRRRARGRVQDRVAQPPERGRAVPGRRDRRRRDPARHLHDGRPADRGPRRAPVRRSGRRRGRGTSSTASSAGSAATATASACRRSAASSCSTRRTPGNPLVNVMAIGAARGAPADAGRGARARATSRSCSARRPGATGSAGRRSSPRRRSRRRPSKRPSVQVGDPFAEKLLIEASLELIERGLVEGLQDLGAGGITCATSETADRAGTGIARRPRRDPAARARAWSRSR